MNRTYRFKQVASVGTSYKVAHLEDGNTVNAGRITRISLILTSKTGSPTKATVVLYGTPASASTHGSAPAETYRKYTLETDVPVTIDATDATKGVGHLDVSDDGADWCYLDEYGHMSEMHIKLDAGSADVTAVTTVRA